MTTLLNMPLFVKVIVLPCFSDVPCRMLCIEHIAFFGRLYSWRNVSS